MRRTITIIFAVAVLGGAIALTQKHNPSNSSATAMPSSATRASSGSASYKDGTYTGDAADTPYGVVQIAVVISGSKISNVEFLRMPDDQPHSREVTMMSEPQLKQNTLDAQSTQIDFVSGATSTCYGYQESLQKALDQAKLT